MISLSRRVLLALVVSTAATGTWRVRAYTDPKRPAIGETTFMVEDYVPDRVEFELTTAAKVLPRKGAAQLSVDGRFLYGTNRGHDSIAEILARGVGKVVEVLALRGFRGQVASALAARKFSADVELVSFFDIKTCAHNFPWADTSRHGD